MRAGTILMYNCSGPEFSKMRQIFAMLHLRMRVVNPEHYHITLGELALGKGEAGEAAEVLPEPMLVFCGLNSALLHQVLEVLRLAQLPPIAMKAVLTETNLGWDTHKLYEELLKEREAIAAQKAEQASEAEAENAPEAQPEEK